MRSSRRFGRTRFATTMAARTRSVLFLRGSVLELPAGSVDLIAGRGGGSQSVPDGHAGEL